MDIFEFAMQMELDGEKYYRGLAEKSNNIGFKKIFTMLAEDEVKHYNVFKSLRDKKSIESVETNVLEGVVNIFSEMKDKKENLSGFNLNQKDVYQKALEMEEKSRDFYLEKAKESSDTAEKDILNRIAKEEQKHVSLIENVINFIAQPETYLENAEFSNLKDY